VQLFKKKLRNNVTQVNQKIKKEPKNKSKPEGLVYKYCRKY
jgi:hypothetical protein